MGRQEIYLLRHGEIDHGERPRFVGQIDLPLTETGILQAEWWAQTLSDTHWTRMDCSDLDRVRQTARIVTGERMDSVQITPRLREIDLGEWDGLAVNDVLTRYSEEWRLRGEDPAGYRPRGGESFSDLSSRVIQILEEIVSQGAEKTLIVAHAGVNRVIICHVLGMPLANLFRICQDYGCLNIIEWSQGSFRLKAMNMQPQLP